MHSHTFLDTGITIEVRKVSPLLLAEFQKKNPPPKPPKVKVMIGDQEKWEENPSDPAYVEKLSQFQIDTELKMRRLLIKYGVVYTLTEEDKARLTELRTAWKEENGEDLPGNDLEVFISYLAIGTPEDLEELIDAIMRRTQPTLSAQKEAEDQFPS